MIDFTPGRRAAVDDFGPLFARALLFRLVVDAVFRPDDAGHTYLPVVERAARWLAGGS